MRSANSSTQMWAKCKKKAWRVENFRRNVIPKCIHAPHRRVCGSRNGCVASEESRGEKVKAETESLSTRLKGAMNDSRLCWASHCATRDGFYPTRFPLLVVSDISSDSGKYHSGLGRNVDKHVFTRFCPFASHGACGKLFLISPTEDRIKRDDDCLRYSYHRSSLGWWIASPRDLFKPLRMPRLANKLGYDCVCAREILFVLPLYLFLICDCAIWLSGGATDAKVFYLNKKKFRFALLGKSCWEASER